MPWWYRLESSWRVQRARNTVINCSLPIVVSKETVDEPRGETIATADAFGLL